MMNLLNNQYLWPIGLGLWLTTWALAIAALIHWRYRSRFLSRDQQLVMSRARQKALRLVEQAKDQALQIIANSRISATEGNSKLEEELTKISADHLREFQELVSNVSKGIESDAAKEIGEFRQAMELETVQSQQVVAAKIQQQYDQLQQELDEAKKKKLTDLDSQIHTIVADVAKQVVGKVVPIKEHEQLIIAALQEAKGKHVI